MILVDPLLPLIVVVAHSIGHWCNNDLPGLQNLFHLRVRLIVAHQILHEVVCDLRTDALIAVKCPRNVHLHLVSLFLVGGLVVEIRQGDYVKYATNQC